jgi:putative transposase
MAVMTTFHPSDGDRVERTALFRYRLIAEALSPRLTPRQRGALVREISSRQHEFPEGDLGTVSRNTLDRWIRDYQAAALRGNGRSARPPTSPRSCTPATASGSRRAPCVSTCAGGGWTARR